MTLTERTEAKTTGKCCMLNVTVNVISITYIDVKVIACGRCGEI